MELKGGRSHPLNAALSLMAREKPQSQEERHEFSQLLRACNQELLGRRDNPVFNNTLKIESIEIYTSDVDPRLLRRHPEVAQAVSAHGKQTIPSSSPDIKSVTGYFNGFTRGATVNINKRKRDWFVGIANVHGVSFIPVSRIQSTEAISKLRDIVH